MRIRLRLSVGNILERQSGIDGTEADQNKRNTYVRKCELQAASNSQATSWVGLSPLRRPVSVEVKAGEHHIRLGLQR